KVEYQVVALQIEQDLLGAKGMKEIRLGFIPPQGGGGGDPGPRPIRPIRPGFGSPVFQTGQEGAFFLVKHPTESFYIAPMFGFTAKKTPNFDKQIEQVKKCAKLLADPKASLKSKDADERLQTAGMLIYRYRNYAKNPTGKAQEKPIDAEESKQILLAIAEGD